MFSKLASLALVSCLCAGTIAQRTLEYTNQAEEELAISQTLDEDEPEFTTFKGDESPEFPLIFRVPLPIPPIKQPKQ